MTIRETINAWRGECVMLFLWGSKIILNILGLRFVYRKMLRRFVKGKGLFDLEYYLKNNADVAQSGTDGLRHYVNIGDKEGRWPMAFFDPNHYRSNATGITKNLHVNSILHYIYVGRYRRTSPSAFFNLEHYLASNKDIIRSGVDPLLHYLNSGGGDDRLTRFPQLAGFTLPEDKAWTALASRAHIEKADIDVIVPVYNARTETLHCLYSVLGVSCQLPFELIVINDASTDLELNQELQKLADRGLCTLLLNEHNLGFVQTANRGMKLHQSRDIVLLNADTAVYDGWLDRLHKAAHRNPKTGTVTPLSNNATICSYPNFLHDNPYPLELGYAEIDALTASINTAIEAEAPTGVGFCMYIRRDCLNGVGLFDEKAFGKGYGEENDFCQRAIAQGWRNIVASDIYVLHLGSASFRGEKAMRVQAALKTLNRKYPHYRQDVDNFIKQDPLKTSRRRLDAHRLKRMARIKNVLLVNHCRGGGSERRMQEDIAKLMQEGYGVFTLRPVARRPTHVNLGHPSIHCLPNINPFELAEIHSLTNALKDIGITEVHTHSLVDFMPDAAANLRKIVSALDAYWKVNLHDYKVICPRVNLVDEDGRYCGEPDDAGCNRCLLERGSGFGVKDIKLWRLMHKDILESTDRIIVPDKDVADRLKKYLPGTAFEVMPHEAIDLKSLPIAFPKIAPTEKLRVVIIGAIGKIKGFNVILKCAKIVRQKNLPIEFIIMGYSMNDRKIRQTGVTVTGKYKEHEALEKLIGLNPHIVWLPSLWPETYSYTLSLGLQAHLPVFSFDIGAIARRLKESGMEGGVMPLSWADNPQQINQQFRKFREDHLI